MNRRTFVRQSSFAALAACAHPFTVSSAAQSSVNPNVYASSNNSAAVNSADLLAGQSYANNWAALGSSLSAARADWIANDVDTTLQSAYFALQPSQLRSSNMDLQRVLSDIQIYNPDATLQSLQACLARYDAQSTDFIQGVINAIQQQGMAPYLQSAITLAAKFASSGNTSSDAISSSQITSAAKRSTVIIPSSRPPIVTDPGNGGTGGGGYSCSTDGILIAAAGRAFLTISVMSAGSAPILMGAAWGAIGAWGGGITTVYGIGHNMKCGF